MRRRQRIVARVGDVFTVPITDELSVVGQVVMQRRQLFVVVIFRAAPQKAGVVDEVAGIDGAVASPFALAGVVFDAKFRNGDWPIIGNRTPVSIVEPWFVVGHQQLGNLRLTNLAGSVERPAKPADAARFDHLTMASPMVLQMAAAADLGLQPWKEEHFDHFRRLARTLSGV